MNLAQTIISEVEKVLLGKPQSVRLSVACLFSEGHLLIDDIPGVGKTTLALALARAISGDFQRIQFTSDLLPSDVLGVSIFNQKVQGFEFKAGPVFHNIVLADEINRASPKTQSALLESMQESQVSIDNQTYPLPKPHFVIATQNPHEHHGTFPLPESQLDRFTMKLSLGYPDEDVEEAILRGDSVHVRVEAVRAVTQPSRVLEAIETVRNIKVDASIDKYIVRIAKATRNAPLIELGLSPRGTIAIRRAAQAFAFTHDRTYVIPDDIKDVAPAVMAHRMRLKGHYNGQTNQTAETVVSELVNQIAVPS